MHIFPVKDDATVDMVLVVEGELPDLVNLRVVLTAEGQHLHSFVNDLLPIPACPDMVQMVQVGVPAADAALLRHQAGIQVVLDIVHEFEQGDAAWNIPIQHEVNQEPLEGAHQAHRCVG